MTLTIDEALRATRWLAALMVALQAIELLSVRHALSAVWSPAFAREDLAAWPMIERVLGPLCEPRPFVGLLIARLALGALLVVGDPMTALVASGLLVVTQLAVSARFGGSFNGGSDGMSMVVSIGLFVAALPLAAAPRFGLGYIAAQALLSYGLAGLVKIRERDWRSGRALTAFVRARRYGVPPLIASRLGAPMAARAASWAVMIFECAFPLGLARPEWMVAVIVVAFGFHLGNWVVFGLNRFVFAWAATYPALVFVASEIARTHGAS